MHSDKLKNEKKTVLLLTDYMTSVYLTTFLYFHN